MLKISRILFTLALVSSNVTLADPPKKEQPTPPAAPSKEPLAATIGNVTITQEEILGKILEVFGPSGAEILKERAKSPEKFAQIYAVFRDQVVSMKLIETEAKAKAEELKKDPLVREGIEAMINKALVSIFTEKYVKAGLTKEFLEKIFAKNPQHLVFLRVIVLNDAATAKAIIKALRSRKSFEELAKTKSVDVATGKNGGGLPPLLEAQLPAPYVKALKDMKEGSFCEEPISAMGKWHVIYFDKKQKATFDEAKPAIQEIASREMVQKLVVSLKEKANVQLYDASGNPTKEASPIFSGAPLKAAATQ